MITPASPSFLSLPSFPAVQGQAVPVADLVQDQSKGQGIIFLWTVLGEINGTKVFMPVNYFPGEANGTVDFGGAPIIGGFNVPGNSSLPGKSTSIEVEFVSAKKPGPIPYLITADSHGNFIDTASAGPLTGPHGGSTLTSSSELSLFALDTVTLNNRVPWGIAQIEYGEVTPVPSATPEPSSLFLAVFAVAGLALYRWRRARASELLVASI